MPIYRRMTNEEFKSILNNKVDDGNLLQNLKRMYSKNLTEKRKNKTSKNKKRRKIKKRKITKEIKL